METFQDFENLEGVRKKQHPTGWHRDTNRSKRCERMRTDDSSGTPILRHSDDSSGTPNPHPPAFLPAVSDELLAGLRERLRELVESARRPARNAVSGGGGARAHFHEQFPHGLRVDLAGRKFHFEAV